LKLDYLVVAVDPNYEWTAVGVPNGNYLWIMGRKSTATDAELSQIMNEVEKTGYPVANSVRVPQEWQ
jgi:apolipoprotein D and lipocalin family protein